MPTRSKKSSERAKTAKTKASGRDRAAAPPPPKKKRDMPVRRAAEEEAAPEARGEAEPRPSTEGDPDER